MSAVGDAVAHENKSAGRSAAWIVICFGLLHEESPSVGMGKRPLICALKNSPFGDAPPMLDSCSVTSAD